MWRREPQALFYVSDRMKRRRQQYTKFYLGGNREREIPDPISNSEVKPLIADGTAHKSVGE